MVKFALSSLMAQGSQVLILGVDPHPSSGHAVVASHIQNRGRLTQMLTQGQSSSPKKKKKELFLVFLIISPTRPVFSVTAWNTPRLLPPPPGEVGRVPCNLLLESWAPLSSCFPLPAVAPGTSHPMPPKQEFIFPPQLLPLHHHLPS